MYSFPYWVSLELHVSTTLPSLCRRVNLTLFSGLFHHLSNPLSAFSLYHLWTPSALFLASSPSSLPFFFLGVRASVHFFHRLFSRAMSLTNVMSCFIPLPRHMVIQQRVVLCTEAGEGFLLFLIVAVTLQGSINTTHQSMHFFYVSSLS